MASTHQPLNTLQHTHTYKLSELVVDDYLYLSLLVLIYVCLMHQ